VSGIFVPKIIKNLLIGFQVTIKNVWDVFLETQCRSADSCETFKSRPKTKLFTATYLNS